MMKADGLDDAIIGVGLQFDKPDRLIYDYDKCIDILMKLNNWTDEEAIEWMEFNVRGAYVGEGTPIFRVSYSQEC
tara:strand:- start:6342 stop:6566 length:225 start_codon:yes stop_codon:yes gene_type:complete